MIIGFTGTRKGLTDHQREMLASFLRNNMNDERSIFLHGGCVGADTDAAMIAGNLGWETWCLPSNIPSTQGTFRSFVTLPQQDPLMRNIQIIQMCDVLLACPKSAAEERRSGTWHTIRCARHTNKDHSIIWPSGVVEHV